MKKDLFGCTAELHDIQYLFQDSIHRKIQSFQRAEPKIIKKYEKLHPYNISQKSQIIVETFRETTKNKIDGKGKMMLVTDSRLAAVRYFHEIKRYIHRTALCRYGYFSGISGSVQDGDKNIQNLD